MKQRRSVRCGGGGGAGGTPPGAGCGLAVELSSGDAGGSGDRVGVGEGCAGERLATEAAPAARDEGEPGGAGGEEGVLDTRVLGPPGAHGATEMAAEVVGHEAEIALGRGLVERVQQRQGACGGARWRALASGPGPCAPT